MSDVHRVYLSLGSNIEPRANLPRAVELLKRYGEVTEVSPVWESEAVGINGPNFLNACVLFLTKLESDELKEKAIRPIEAELGRVRHADKNAPRTIDIDIVLFDDMPFNVEYWGYAFVTVPLAELIPDFVHPTLLKKLSLAAEEMKSSVWIEKRIHRAGL